MSAQHTAIPIWLIRSAIECEKHWSTIIDTKMNEIASVIHVRKTVAPRPERPIEAALAIAIQVPIAVNGRYQNPIFEGKIESGNWLSRYMRMRQQMNTANHMLHAINPLLAAVLRITFAKSESVNGREA